MPDRFFDRALPESNPREPDAVDGCRGHADLFFLWDDDGGYRILPGDAALRRAVP